MSFVGAETVNEKFGRSPTDASDVDDGISVRSKLFQARAAVT